MPLNFQLAGGTVAGWDHRNPRGVPKNRQDDYWIRGSPDVITATVADGCGEGKRSELGAALAVRLLSTSLHRYLDAGYPCDQTVLGRVRQELVSYLNVLATSMGPSLSEVVKDCFLFTVLGVAITPVETTFFGLGDGVIVVNGDVTILQPEAGNKPIYLGYALTGSDLSEANPAALDFQTHCQLPTADLTSFLIGTDGAGDIHTRSSELMPGSDELIGPLSQFWTEDRYFTSKVGVERKLNLIARQWDRRLPDGRHVTDGGKLPDDTTIVVGRNLHLLDDREG